MNRNRLVQLVAVLVAVVCLVGTAMVTPTVNRQRSELFDNQLVENLPPQYALLAALGSFRGLAVDALWYRAEMLKREGKFFDAKTLRDAIVTLQPRFPQVWRYQAWDMAYNISVATHTPQERWDWVSKGIRLLREEGIPNNPESVELYRELAWIFFHKVGQYSDDMHWYYKVQLAQEWQELLGAPTEGATADEVLAEFKPIAEAAERYFAFDGPSRESEAALNELMVEHENLEDPLERALELSLPRFIERLTAIRRDLMSEQPGVAERLAAIQQAEYERLARAGQDPLNLLLADAPEVEPVLQQLRELGGGLDSQTLRRLGRLQMYIRYIGEDAVVARADQLPEDERRLLPLVTDPANPAGYDKLLSYLRAKVLTEDYHMDPAEMYEVMEIYGPLDWRHAASHSLYWSEVGIEKAGLVRDRSKIDWLNTTRQRMHSIQELTRYGNVNYDPFNQTVALMPDTRFVPFYEKAMQDGLEAARQYQWQGGGNEDSFEAGHENYLLMAMVYEYIYGQEDRARELFDKARKLYADKPHNQHSGRYLLPLRDLVMTELQQDWDMTNMARALVMSRLQRAFIEGLAQGDIGTFNRFLDDARAFHARYQQERGYGNVTAPRHRLVMLPFDQTVAEAYIAFMQQPDFHPLGKARVYANTPLRLQQATYNRWREAVRQQSEAFAVDFNKAFPAPPGVEVQDVAPRDMTENLPQTIERK